jgi:outer membrane protein TolC
MTTTRIWPAVVGSLTAGLLGAQEAPGRLTISEAVRLAVEASPTLRAAGFALEGAEGSVREAAALRLPSLTADGSLVRYQEPMIIRPLHELSATSLPEFNETLVQGGLSLGYLLFDGGSRGGRIAQARAVRSASDLHGRAMEQTVVAGTVRAYVEVLTAASVLEAQERRARALESELERVQRFLTEGRAARVEQLRAEAALALSRADLAATRARRDAAELALARLLAVDRSRTGAGLLRPLRVVAPVAGPRNELLTRAESASPGLRAAAERVAAAEAGARIAGGTRWPNLRVEGRLVTYGSAAGDYTAEWQAGLRVAYPVYTGGGRSAGIDRAEAAVEEAHADLGEARLELAGRLDRAMAASSEIEARVEALSAAVTHLTEVARTEALALDQGAGVQTDYLRAEADLTTAQAQLAQSTGLAVLTQVELAQVIGALSSTDLPRLLESMP